jgi:hypothetical protein
MEVIWGRAGEKGAFRGSRDSGKWAAKGVAYWEKTFYNRWFLRAPLVPVNCSPGPVISFEIETKRSLQESKLVSS